MLLALRLLVRILREVVGIASCAVHGRAMATQDLLTLVEERPLRRLRRQRQRDEDVTLAVAWVRLLGGAHHSLREVRLRLLLVHLALAGQIRRLCLLVRPQSAEVDLGNDSGLLPLLGWLLVQFGERLEVPSELVLVRRRIRAVRTLA